MDAAAMKMYPSAEEWYRIMINGKTDYSWEKGATHGEVGAYNDQMAYHLVPTPECEVEYC
ncbi:MAG: hypothetical protein A2583_15970 [Bdellovibrionales bacterium RIFOXYD1_FULL_53_11]|nr:MAG: hypothetical protein A2583_15970 [Bdellovibrionales bacterium RIFOXYD1_FULL_53_11]